MNKLNKVRIILFAILFFAVTLFPQNVHAIGYKVDDTRIQFIYETKKYAVMDSIVNYIDKTLECCPTDTLKKYHKTGNYQINIYPINTKDYSYESKQAAFCEFDPTGEYYIELLFCRPECEDVFEFRYNGLNFVSPTYLNGFFSKFNEVSFDKGMPFDDEIDEIGDVCDWRFIVIDGEILIAEIASNSDLYDLKSNKEIRIHDFFRVLPYPVEKYSSLEEWKQRVDLIKN